MFDDFEGMFIRSICTVKMVTVQENLLHQKKMKETKD